MKGKKRKRRGRRQRAPQPQRLASPIEQQLGELLRHGAARPKPRAKPEKAKQDKPRPSGPNIFLIAEQHHGLAIMPSDWVPATDKAAVEFRLYGVKSVFSFSEPEKASAFAKEIDRHPGVTGVEMVSGPGAMDQLRERRMDELLLRMEGRL